MAKNTPVPQTVETILEQIHRYLSPEEIGELRDKLPHKVELSVTTDGMFIDVLEAKQRRLKEDLDFTDKQLIKTERELVAAKKESANRIRKRGMSKERIETAEAELKLRLQYQKQSSRYLALVKLPAEQEKDYAKEYKTDGNYERLRSCIKSIMRDFKKYKSNISPK